MVINPIVGVYIYLKDSHFWSVFFFGQCFFFTGKPIPSMCGLFTYIWWMFMVNVGTLQCMDGMGKWWEDLLCDFKICCATSTCGLVGVDDVDVDVFVVGTGGISVCRCCCCCCRGSGCGGGCCCCCCCCSCCCCCCCRGSGCGGGCCCCCCCSCCCCCC